MPAHSVYDNAFVENLSPGFVFAGLPVPSAKFVQILLAVRAGTTTEEVGEEGYTELLATLLSRGAGELDRQAFALECDRRGCVLNTYPGRDVLMLELSVLPEDLAWGLELLESMLSRPRLEETEIAIAVEEQKEQNSARSDEQRTALADLARATLFAPGHAYARPASGLVDSPQLGGRQALVDFHAKLLLSEAPMALVATGAIQPHHFTPLMARVFGPLAGQRKWKEMTLAPALFHTSPERFGQLNFPVEQSRLLIGLPGIARTDSAYLETHWANEMFGGAFLSRLTRAVRSKEGLAYSAGSSLWPAFRGGCLWISMQTDHRNVPKALRTIRVVMEEVLRHGFPVSEVEQFRRFAESSLVFEYDSLSGLASRLMDHLLLGEPWRPEDRRQLLTERIQKERLERALARVLHPESAIIATSGPKVPKSSAEAFFDTPSATQMAQHSVPPLETYAGPSAPQPADVLRGQVVAQHDGATLLAYPNGLHLLSLPRPELLSISLQVWTRTGSMDEPTGASGMSHLLEHLMFRGTTRFPDGQFDAILAQKGGVNNAFTSEDFTVYTDYIVPEGLEEALCLEADRFQNLEIGSELFTTEREVVLEERSLRVDASPLGKVYEELQRAAFPSHPYGWPVIGWREDLLNLTAERLMQHYRQASTLERLLVVIAGGCETETADLLVGRTFGATETAEPSEKCWPTVAADGPVAKLSGTDLTFHERSGYSYLLAALRFPREGHPDYEAAELLSRILGTGDSCRLHDVFVREKRLALEVWASYEPQARDHPLLHLGVATTDDFDFEAYKAELGVLLTDLAESVSEEELEKVRRGWIAEEAFSTDELEEWALETAGRVMLMPWEQVWKARERVEAVTTEDLRRVARLYLEPSAAVFAHLKAKPEARD